MEAEGIRQGIQAFLEDNTQAWDEEPVFDDTTLPNTILITVGQQKFMVMVLELTKRVTLIEDTEPPQ